MVEYLDLGLLGQWYEDYSRVQLLDAETLLGTLQTFMNTRYMLECPTASVMYVMVEYQLVLHQTKTASDYHLLTNWVQRNEGRDVAETTLEYLRASL